MLKIRVIPILTFNGFALVKTKQFSNPRMVGNPVQAARVFNSRGVDELIFLDIFASKQNRKLNLKLVKDVINECFMPVGIGGGVNSLEDINNLLKIGADKIVINKKAFESPKFVTQASNFFGSQCISVSIDVVKNENSYYVFHNKSTNVKLEDYIQIVQNSGAGELIINSVEKDGMMNGFDVDLYNKIESITSLPIVMVGGAGDITHYRELFSKSNCEAVGSSSIFYFTQFTPKDIKNTLKEINKPVRI